MQGKLQGRCGVWRSSWAQQIHCNPSASLGANQLVSKGRIETHATVLQKIYVIWYRFCILGKSFARPFDIKESIFLDPVLAKMKIICFWFQTMKNDWIWRKIFEKFIIILNVSVNIIAVLFFQVLSLFEKLHSRF